MGSVGGSINDDIALNWAVHRVDTLGAGVIVCPHSVLGGIPMDECCRNCRIAKLVVKSTVVGLLIGGVWVCATIGVIAIWGGM